jgi:hypothetical protein
MTRSGVSALPDRINPTIRNSLQLDAGDALVAVLLAKAKRQLIGLPLRGADQASSGVQTSR